jgi:hypothetical protein
MGFDESVIGLNCFNNNPCLSRNGGAEDHKGKGDEKAYLKACYQEYLKRYLRCVKAR